MAEAFILLSLGSLMLQLVYFIAYRKVVNAGFVLVPNPHYHWVVAYTIVSAVIMAIAVVARIEAKSPWGNRDKGTVFGQRVRSWCSTSIMLTLLVSVIAIGTYMYGHQAGNNLFGPHPWTWSIWFLSLWGLLILSTAFSWNIWIQLPGKPPEEPSLLGYSAKQLERFVLDMREENLQPDTTDQRRRENFYSLNRIFVELSVREISAQNALDEVVEVNTRLGLHPVRN